jgi:hypothetical protein
MRALLAALLWLGAAPLGAAQEGRGRYAVIIDAGSVPLYREQVRLESPTGSLVDAFSAQGYRVSWIEGKGLSRAETLRQLFQLATDLTAEDTLVVYCGGYAVRHPLRQGGAYLMLEGASLDALETNGIRIEELADILEKVRAKEKLLLFDLLFLGDAVYAPEKDAKMQAQRQMRYPEVSLERGILPLSDLTALRQREALSHVALAISPAAASRLESRGLLGSAVRNAIAGEADDDSDRRLETREMASYVRESIERRTAGANLSPGDVQLTMRVAHDWVVAAAGRSVSRERRERYLATLREWRDRNWISVGTELSARSVLDQWIRSLETNTPLDPNIQELWELLQKHMEGSGNDVDRARSLEAQIRKRY